MDKEVKNKVQADLLTSAIAIGITVAISGIVAGVSGIVCFAHNRKEAKSLWNNGLSAEERNTCRRIWFEVNQDKNRFADLMIERGHKEDTIRYTYGESEERERLKIFAKHLKKELGSPMEEIPV